MKDEDKPDSGVPSQDQRLEDATAAPESTAVDASPLETTAVLPEVDTDAAPPRPQSPFVRETPAVGADSFDDAEPTNPHVTPSPPPAASAPVAPRRAGSGGFFAALLGGALAAVAGFALSHYNLLELRSEVDQASIETAVAAKLTNALDSQMLTQASQTEQALAALRAEVTESTAAAGAALPEALAEVQALTARVTALDQALAQASAATEGGASAAAVAALSAELAQLKSAVAAAPKAEVDPAETRRIVDQALQDWEGAARARSDEAAAAAKATALQEAARIALAQAVDTGAPFESALAALGQDQIPAALADFAAQGLPTRAALQASFPDAARAALEASLRDGNGGGDRFWSFLRIQTGARSLTPQTGSDPDAILSRAEAALHADDFAKALTEIEALPAPGQAAMADWVKAARSRAEATTALAPLLTTP